MIQNIKKINFFKNTGATAFPNAHKIKIKIFIQIINCFPTYLIITNQSLLKKIKKTYQEQFFFLNIFKNILMVLIYFKKLINIYIYFRSIL